MSDAGTDAGTARFTFTGSLSAQRDDSDGKQNAIINEGDPVMVGYSLENVGSVAGAADVTVSIDGAAGPVSTTPAMQPGAGGPPPPDGFARGFGPYSAGTHTLSATVGPSGSGTVDATAPGSSFDVEAAQTPTPAPAPAPTPTPTP